METDELMNAKPTKRDLLYLQIIIWIMKNSQYTNYDNSGRLIGWISPESKQPDLECPLSPCSSFGSFNVWEHFPRC